MGNFRLANDFFRKSASLDPLWKRPIIQAGVAALDAGHTAIKQIIAGMFAEIEVGAVYQGRIVTMKDFGCFVEVMPGKDGMVHISEFADFRVNRMEDVAKIGDVIWVKCIGVDEKGRVKLSRKAAMKEMENKPSPSPATSDIP